jgi:two-component system, OmpR family, sensor histidine kinase KdpD
VSGAGRAGLAALAAIACLGGTTALITILESVVGVPNASAGYLLAVVIMAVAFGTWAAVGTAVAALLLYDFLFVLPLYTFTISDPGEWLNLLLLLGVGIVVGQLAALQRNRAEMALAREQESRALFEVSRAFASGDQAQSTLAAVAALLLAPSGMERLWIGLGPTPAQETVAGEAGEGRRGSMPAIRMVLAGTPGSTQAGGWVRIHVPGLEPSSRASGQTVYQVLIRSGDRVLGSIWGWRTRGKRVPSPEQTRLLEGAADQVAQTLVREQFAREATSAEVARRSEAAKSALLDSVSHDLRTPLASIRAAAGSLMDPAVHWEPDEQRSTAAAIDREAERLDQLVTNLLDMSRIEAGALHAVRQVVALDDVVGDALTRQAGALADRRLSVEVDGLLPFVEVDPLFMDQILANVLQNAARYTPPTARISIRAEALSEEPLVRLTIEDEGAGVPDGALPHLFDKFYRVPRPREGSRRGTGMGLAVVKGMAEAMGARVGARRGASGGLAIDLDLPIADRPRQVDEEAGDSRPAETPLPSVPA